jgi:hypothetical protein
VAQVQKNSGTTNGVTSIVTSLGSATTAGNSILLMVSSAGTLSTPAGFTSRSPQVNIQGCYLFEKLVASGNATDTPSMTQGGAYNAVWFIAEYSGITAFRTSNGSSSTNNGAGSYATPGITPVAGNTLFVAYMGITGSNATTTTFGAGEPSSWTNSFTGQQSLLRPGSASAGQDSLAGGWATFQVNATGSTAYSTAASYTLPTAGLGNPHRIIAAYAHAAGPLAYTMPATTGTLTASGQANKLARSRDMNAVNGTLTLSGPTVNLIYSGAGPKLMPGGIGFLSASGQAATLARSRKMPSVNGTLTLSGQTAGLRGVRKTAGGLGILTLGGQTSRLVRSRLFPAGLGTLTLSGPVVNLIKSGGGPKTLPGGIGFPLLGGQQAILRYARKMPALTGTLTASGKPVTLTYVAFEGDIVMPVSAGVLAMSGHPAFLDVTRVAPKTMKLQFGRKVYLRRW